MMGRPKRGMGRRGSQKSDDQILAEQNAAALDQLEEQIDQLVDQVERAQKNRENLDELATQLDQVGKRVDKLSGGSGASQQLGRSAESKQSVADLERDVFDM